MTVAFMAPGMGFSLLASAEARFTATLFARLEASDQISTGQAAQEVLESLQEEPALLLKSLAQDEYSNTQQLERFHREQGQRLFPDNLKWNTRAEMRVGVKVRPYRHSDEQDAQYYLRLWESVLEQGVSEFVGCPRSWCQASEVLERHYSQAASQPLEAMSIGASSLGRIGLQSLSETEFKRVLDEIAQQSLKERAQSIRFVIDHIGAVGWGQLPTDLVQQLFRLSEGLGKRHPIRPQVQREIGQAIESAGYHKFAAIFLRVVFPEDEE